MSKTEGINNKKAWKIILAIIYLILCFMGFSKGFYRGISVLLIFVPLPIMLFSVVCSIRDKSFEGLLSIPAWILSFTIALGITAFLPDNKQETEKTHIVSDIGTETTVSVAEDDDITEKNTSVIDGDDIVYITASGSKYHDKTCTSMKSEGIEITLGEAVTDGYESCKNCIKQ